MADLLIELFSEEIPARMQARAAADLRRLMTDALVEAGLTYAEAGAFSTPRRLALALTGLTAASAPRREERKGPRVDAPEAALEGFLRSTGLSRDQLQARDDKKGQVWFAVIEHPGRPAEDIVAEALEAVIRDFPWPKSMRWGSGSLRWVRPLHSILCLLGDEQGARVVPVEIDGIRAGNVTRGHRFMAPDAFAVTGFEDYAARLRRAFVVLDPAAREAAIRHGAEQLAFARGLEIVPDDGLMAELSGLVEWPVPLMGVIEDRFLSLPPEVLQTSMREHQKFLSARNPKTGRIEGFVTVANIEAADDGAAILAGNQRVLAARLSDAAFFWDLDLREAKAGMENWAEGLKSVTFQSKLGSQADRVERIADLAQVIAADVSADADQAKDAARIAKLDLRSAMVGEFPELQGVMGRYYALEADKPDAVADAARDHWSPKGESDAVPTAPVSVAVALADKLDTLAGFWAIGEKPTGSKDPFALRRAALGVIRLVLRNEVRSSLKHIAIGAISDVLQVAKVRVFSGYMRGISLIVEQEPQQEDLYDPISLLWQHGEELSEFNKSRYLAFTKRETLTGLSVKDLAEQAERWYRKTVRETETKAADLLAFFHDRLKAHLRDEGIRHDIIDAVLALPGNDDLVLVVRRAEALAAFLKTEDGENLTQGLKRGSSLLADEEKKDGVEYSFGPDPKLAETEEERALFAALDKAEPLIAQATKGEDFPAAMAAIAGLRAPIDAFFEAVQVNADNTILRRNRLNLLHRIREAGRGIADFSRIEG